jgi:hypothetical protein
MIDYPSSLLTREGGYIMGSFPRLLSLSGSRIVTLLAGLESARRLSLSLPNVDGKSSIDPMGLSVMVLVNAGPGSFPASG